MNPENNILPANDTPGNHQAHNLTKKFNSRSRKTILIHPRRFYSIALSENQCTWIQLAYTYYLSYYMKNLATREYQFSNMAPFSKSIHLVYGTIIPNNTDILRCQSQQTTSNRNDISNYNDHMDDNIGNNMHNNDEEEDNIPENHRDWLDNFYTLSRITVLFSIVYFYSSPLRFIIVTFLAFIIYLYHNGFFRTYPAEFANNDHHLGDNNQMQENENDASMEHRQLHNRHPSQNQLPIRIFGNGVERSGALSFMWMFLSSFFASLVPDQRNQE